MLTLAIRRGRCVTPNNYLMANAVRRTMYAPQTWNLLPDNMLIDLVGSWLQVPKSTLMFSQLLFTYHSPREPYSV